MSHHHITPAQLARYDQEIAEMDATIDTLINAYNITADEGEWPTPIIILGLSKNIEECAESAKAAAQYLAVAIRRLARIEKACRELADHYETITGNPIPGTPPT